MTRIGTQIVHVLSPLRGRGASDPGNGGGSRRDAVRHLCGSPDPTGRFPWRARTGVRGEPSSQETTYEAIYEPFGDGDGRGGGGRAARRLRARRRLSFRTLSAEDGGREEPGAVAHAGSGPIPDNGTHYNLNIIGVPRDKTVPDMTGSNRHVIFVPLESGADVDRRVNVFYVAGDQFRVLDGNATNDNVATIMVPSEPAGDLCYNVWATALGKPNGNAVVGAQCVIDGLLGSCTATICVPIRVMCCLLTGNRVRSVRGMPVRFRDPSYQEGGV
jgi:hypothetical protein